jgi:hypothetical protein
MPLVADAAASRARVARAATPFFTEPPAGELRTGLEAVGLAVDDTREILAAFARGASISDVDLRISLGSLLRKRSSHGREHALTAIRRRYLLARPPLPSLRYVAAAVTRMRSRPARAQTLLPYLVLSDRGAYEALVDVVLPRTAGAQLIRRDVELVLTDQLRAAGRRPWGAALTTRWAQGFLSVMREVGILGRLRERQRLLAYEPRSDAFAFHLRGLYDAGVRGDALVDSQFWRCLGLRDGVARGRLADVAAAGWFRVRVVAGVTEVAPTHPNLMDWIDDALG